MYSHYQALQPSTLALVGLSVFIAQTFDRRELLSYKGQAFERRSFHVLVRSNAGCSPKPIRWSRPTCTSSFSTTSPHGKAAARELDKGLEPQILYRAQAVAVSAVPRLRF